jgi:hypothetical protein
MKKLIASLLALALVAVAFAALTQSTTFYRFQCDPKFDANGAPTSAVVQAFTQTTVMDGANQVASSVTLSAQWDAVALASKTVTANGKTYTYGEVLTAILAIAAQEKTVAP